MAPDMVRLNCRASPDINDLIVKIAEAAGTDRIGVICHTTAAAEMAYEAKVSRFSGT